MGILHIIKPCHQFQQLLDPINDVILYLASDWLLLVIDSSSCSDNQSEARENITLLIEWRDC